jgi:dTMP kinase
MNRSSRSSKAQRGLFVSVDGPSGARKSTIVQHLAQLLISAGHDVHVTAEPSAVPIGELCRDLTDDVTGEALACLYAADRYHHLEHEIRPALEAGRTVISDRYLASGLVMQRLDGLDLDYLWQLNAAVDRPDLAVILDADPQVIAERLTARGTHNRFQEQLSSSYDEVRFYRQATEHLTRAGFNVTRIDCSRQPPEHCAELIHKSLVP